MREALRSMATSSHRQRVSAYSALLAKGTHLDESVVRVASRLHDVGMSSVPASIMGRRGPLTVEERREMEQHTELGWASLFGSGVEPLETAAEIALTHHERWDGAGYPRGLAGEAIPLSGRIVAIADTFDALTTPRSYRSPVSVDEAVEILRDERGRQLDPDLVDAFIEMLPDVVAIFEEHPPPDGDDAAPFKETDEAPMTLQAAAATLAISPSRLRRWADEGRIPAVRTAGGHRRFPLEAVRKLAAERGVRPNVRPVTPPEEPLPTLARCLAAHGRQMAAAAASAVYRDGPPGWFASDAAKVPTEEWLQILEDACRQGVYTTALQASDTLMRRAHTHAATLLERHAFLERFGQVSVRTLVRAGADRTELAATRRLFTALQQALLETRD
jgi:excisionase family DNA binding protein